MSTLTSEIDLRSYKSRLGRRPTDERINRAQICQRIPVIIPIIANINTV
jgi:hypothetical protein